MNRTTIERVACTVFLLVALVAGLPSAQAERGCDTESEGEDYMAYCNYQGDGECTDEPYNQVPNTTVYLRFCSGRVEIYWRFNPPTAGDEKPLPDGVPFSISGNCLKEDRDRRLLQDGDNDYYRHSSRGDDNKNTFESDVQCIDAGGERVYYKEEWGDCSGYALFIEGLNAGNPVIGTCRDSNFDCSYTFVGTMRIHDTCA